MDYSIIPVSRDDGFAGTGIFSDDPTCKRCNYGINESIMHVLHDCPVLGDFWDRLIREARVVPSSLLLSCGHANFLKLLRNLIAWKTKSDRLVGPVGPGIGH